MLTGNNRSLGHFRQLESDLDLSNRSLIFASIRLDTTDSNSDCVVGGLRLRSIHDWITVPYACDIRHTVALMVIGIVCLGCCCVLILTITIIVNIVFHSLYVQFYACLCRMSL